MKIELISGHGRNDCGAVGCGFKEADKTRELVNLIASKLKAYAEVVVYDQSRNAFEDAQNGKLAIAKDVDYVFEVHFNAFNGQAYGTEIWVTDREKAVTVEEQIMNQLGIHFVKRGVKRKNFLVINTVKNMGISSALLETCFIDNEKDMAIYEANKDRIAMAIVTGIVGGFGLKKIKTPQAKPVKKSVDEIAREVINGTCSDSRWDTWGNGTTRKERLTTAGYNYSEVQKRVNELCGVKVATPKLDLNAIAREVYLGMHGNGMAKRSASLKAKYGLTDAQVSQVQQLVNKMCK